MRPIDPPDPDAGMPPPERDDRLSVSGWLCARGLTRVGIRHLWWALGVAIGMSRYAPTGLVDEEELPIAAE